MSIGQTSPSSEHRPRRTGSRARTRRHRLQTGQYAVPDALGLVTIDRARPRHIRRVQLVDAPRVIIRPGEGTRGRLPGRYQETGPRSLWYSPLGPSSPSVANSTMTLAPSLTVRLPCPRFMSVATYPVVPALILRCASWGSAANVRADWRVSTLRAPLEDQYAIRRAASPPKSVPSAVND